MIIQSTKKNIFIHPYFLLNKRVIFGSEPQGMLLRNDCSSALNGVSRVWHGPRLLVPFAVAPDMVTIYRKTPATVAWVGPATLPVYFIYFRILSKLTFNNLDRTFNRLELEAKRKRRKGICKLRHKSLRKTSGYYY